MSATPFAQLFGPATLRASLSGRISCAAGHAGPDRKLFLPGGLLDRDTDVPEYLNGVLAGE